MKAYITATISAAAVRANLQLLRKQVGPTVKLCPAVKSDCYGHGIELLHELIAEESDGLSVACPNEAIDLRELGYKGPLLSFFSACAYSAPERSAALEELIVGDVTQTIVDEYEIALIATEARRLNRQAAVHLKIDTGMGRSGVVAEKAARVAALIHAEPNLSLTGIFTHFANAGEADRTFTHRQFALFRECAETCRAESGVLLHVANSVATIDLPQMHLDMVRPGIAVYGYQPSADMQTHLPLQPALHLTTPLLQVKSVPAGTSCGYGLTWTFDKPGLIGRVPIGYGDGYPRCLSNRANVQVRGVAAPLRGRVSMDQLIIDLTEVPGAQIGDEVEIISPRPSAPNSVDNLARLADTIPYEITCRLGGPRLRRVLR